MVCYRLAVWPGKNTTKLAILVYTNLGYLTLEGPGRQTVNTRSTSRAPLKTLGYDASIKLAIWKAGGTKIERTRPPYIFLCVCTEIREKVIIWVKRLAPENFQQENFSRLLTPRSLTHSGFRKYSRFG